MERKFSVHVKDKDLLLLNISNTFCSFIYVNKFKSPFVMKFLNSTMGRELRDYKLSSQLPEPSGLTFENLSTSFGS